jgi:hypothetical protein
MNNYEKIKKMTIDEMAEYHAEHVPKTCWMCTGTKNGCLREISCKSGIKQWLESEEE